MEIQSQQHHSKEVIKSNLNKKFVGVRQRPSGRWVAEIKDTTHKIRMWLGTYATAEEAARAYDQAACLLRGSNTRTNFVTRVPADSPMAARIRNLLNTKTCSKQLRAQPTKSSSNNTNVLLPSTSSSVTRRNNSDDDSVSSGKIPDTDSFSYDIQTQFDGATYDYELQKGSSSSSSWSFEKSIEFAEELIEFPKTTTVAEMGISEFERMGVERSISASLYAVHGVEEYMQAIKDASESLWDLPPLCSLSNTY